jgi:hypothetical protein
LVYQLPDETFGGLRPTFQSVRHVIAFEEKRWARKNHRSGLPFFVEKEEGREKEEHVLSSQAQ